MARPMIIIVADDSSQHDQVKSYGNTLGATVKSYQWTEWARNLEDAGFRRQMMGDVPALAFGSSPVDTGAKILPFPPSGQSQSGHSDAGKKVRTINELESIAIENAIHEYNGNLTEAAKALGIGRATLYRKVKQYNIDPMQARSKRRAA